MRTHSPSVDRPRKHRHMHHLVGNIASDRCVLCVEIAHGFEELTLLDANGGRTSTVRGKEEKQSRRGDVRYKRSRWTEEMENIKTKIKSMNMMSMDTQNLLKDDSQILLCVTERHKQPKIRPETNSYELEQNSTSLSALLLVRVW